MTFSNEVLLKKSVSSACLLFVSALQHNPFSEHLFDCVISACIQFLYLRLMHVVLSVIAWTRPSKFKKHLLPWSCLIHPFYWKITICHYLITYLKVGYAVALNSESSVLNSFACQQVAGPSNCIWSKMSVKFLNFRSGVTERQQHF